MGLDCSGYVQMVFKALGVNIKRDTSQQIEMGLSIEREMLNTGDLVFFKKEHQSKVSHVGIMLSKTDVIHASGIVRIDTLSKNTMTVDKQFDYQAIAFRMIHS
jgi:cell wall-associated NlpC family hydrolase